MEGLPYYGSPTKVFGYIGLPAGLQPGERCPAMVLLHVSKQPSAAGAATSESGSASCRLPD